VWCLQLLGGLIAAAAATAAAKYGAPKASMLPHAEGNAYQMHALQLQLHCSRNISTDTIFTGLLFRSSTAEHQHASL
jgi:hypothetical protein